MNDAIVELKEAIRLLAEVKTIQGAQKVIGLAEAARVYAQQSKLGLEAQNYATEIKLRAERRAGDILAQAQMNEGGRPPETPSGGVRGFHPTLREVGISYKESSRWQLEARVPEKKFEGWVAQLNAQGEELTSAGLRNLALTIQRVERKTNPPPLPQGVYNVILADPPWPYDNHIASWGPAEKHYPAMSLEELCALKVPVADNAALFLWVTNPFLREGLQVTEAWGFEYKTNIVWVKTNRQRPGVGFYVRGWHELLFVCTRGSFVPDHNGHGPLGSVIEADVREHSRKPEEAYTLIEQLYPGGNYAFLEIFARHRRPNWTPWGAELDDEPGGCHRTEGGRGVVATPMG